MKPMRSVIALIVALAIFSAWSLPAKSSQAPQIDDGPKANAPPYNAGTHDGSAAISPPLSAPLIVTIPQTFTSYPEQRPYDYHSQAYDSPPQKDAPDWTAIAQVAFSFLLVLVGVGQVCVGRLQYLTYERQRRLMRRQANISSHQTELLETQSRLTALQTDILEKQKEIARQGHIATHRPRLSVRNVVIRAEQRSWPGLPELILGEMLTGQLYVVNRGGYEAQITDALVMIYQTDKPHLPMERPYEGQNGNIGRWAKPLLAGQSSPIPFGLNEPVSADVRSRIIDGKDGKRLYVMGWIEYRDGGYDIRSDTHFTRRTAFCRLFDTERQRFVRVDDEDYEHEE